MIKSFADARTEDALAGKFAKGFPTDIARRAQRKLEMIDKAQTYSDLANPPGNGLHSLTGDRAGQSAIKINDQWRICFHWKDGEAHDVEIVDYH